MMQDMAMGNSRFERKPVDFYPTPIEVTQALIPYLFQHPFNLSKDNVIWEPACGNGAMSNVIKNSFKEVISTDINYYGYGYPGVDFLECKEPFSSVIITNPPYSEMAEKFIRKGLELTKPYNGIICMLLRKEYDSAAGRNDLFNEQSPFCMKIDLLWRPRWFEYVIGDPGPRHNFSWFCWNWNYTGKALLEYAHRPGKKIK